VSRRLFLSRQRSGMRFLQRPVNVFGVYQFASLKGESFRSGLMARFFLQKESSLNGNN
jgi:hypothetical protein